LEKKKVTSKHLVIAVPFKFFFKKEEKKNVTGITEPDGHLRVTRELGARFPDQVETESGSSLDGVSALGTFQGAKVLQSVRTPQITLNRCLSQ